MPPAQLPTRPPEWQPLVSAAQWTILAHALHAVPEVLGDLRVVLAQLSPGVRRALLSNLMQRLASGGSPVRAVWTSLALTGHELKLRSAVALGELDATENHAGVATVTSILPKP